MVPMPSSVNISKSNECFLRPSIIWHDSTPFSMARTQVSIFGIIPPEIIPLSINSGTSEILIF